MRVGNLLRPSIACRLTLALLLACGLVWLAIYAQGMYNVHKSGSGSFDTEMLTLAEAAAHVVDANAQTGASELAQALTGIEAMIGAEVKVRGSPGGFLAFQVRTADEAVVARGGHGPEALSGGKAQTGYFDATADGQGYRVYRVWSEDRRHRIEVTQSHLSRQQIFDAVMLSREGFLNPLMVGFPLLLLPVWLAVYSGLAPLRRLSSELASRKPSDLQPLKVLHVYSELEPLVRELNATMARLQGLLQRERDFLADAAHELRTPLALISAQCDTLLHAEAPQLREEAARRLQVGLARSSRLVNQLLSLARLDADLEDTLLTTDVADVARDCLAAHAREARARSIELSYSGPNSLVTQCPGQAVDSILDNLVGNAIRYGRPGGLVVVRAAVQANDELHLTVLDDGPGISPEERTRMFERFRRGIDPAASGSGLGLAIVASAARQLGARIVVSDGLRGEGVCFSLTWAPPSGKVVERGS